MFSIRRRLTAVLAIGSAALIVVVGLSVHAGLAERLRADFDAAMVTKAQALIALTDQEAGEIELDYGPGLMPEFERETEPEYFQFWLDDFACLYRSSRLEGDLCDPRGAGQEPGLRDSMLPDGRDGRLLTIAFVPGVVRDALEVSAPTADGLPRRGLVLALARERHGLDALLLNLRNLTLAIAGIAAVVSALFAWFALSFAFRPIDALAAQVERLDDAELDTTIALARPPQELSPIIDQLNALLLRLRDSFERERRFTGNVAHELRTPISELQTLASVASRWPDDAEAVRAFFGDVGDIAQRMEHVLADLFLLARCQAGVEPRANNDLAIGRTVESIWKSLAANAIDHGITLKNAIPSGLILETDAHKLGIVLRNLLDNAVSHGARGTAVSVVARLIGDRVDIEVSNAAEPIDAENFAHLTEPFWRDDPARSNGAHAGLGLTLVAVLCEVLGLGLDLSQSTDGIFHARLRGLRSGVRSTSSVADEAVSSSSSEVPEWSQP